MICSKTPIWNPDINSLVIKFDAGRITQASSKNFILYNAKDCNNDHVDASQAIMQFGKTHSRR